MKSYILSFIILLLTLAFTNCKKPQRFETFVEFPVSVTLNHKPVSLGKQVMYPSGFVFLDGALVVLDIAGDYFLNFFSLDDFSLINQRIRRGRGPLEEESVFGLVKGSGDNELWYKTPSGIKIVKYDMGHDELIYVRAITECESFDGVTFMLNNDVLGIPRNFQSKEFVKVLDDCTLADFGPGFPEVGRKLENKDKGPLGTKSVRVKPDGSLFAAAYNHFPIIRIFNANDGSLKSDVRFQNKQDFPHARIDPNASQTEMLSTNTNYFTIHTTSNFIYASYAGKSFLELQPNIIEEGFKIMDFTSEIHVFDWEGNPIMQLLLDKYFFSFAVCPEDRTLLAIPMSEPDLLLLYDLSSVFKNLCDH